MLGVKASGRFPMAWDTDPAAVETCFCGAPIASPCGIDGRATAQDGTCIAVRRQPGPKYRPPSRRGGPSANRAGARQSAVCRVACLEWVWWMGYPPGVPCARRCRALTPETRPAKEAKRCVACHGNHLGGLRGASPRGPAGDCSTDSVAIRSRRSATRRHALSWETTVSGDARQGAGKSNRT